MRIRVAAMMQNTCYGLLNQHVLLNAQTALLRRVSTVALKTHDCDLCWCSSPSYFLWPCALLRFSEKGILSVQSPPGVEFTTASSTRDFLQPAPEPARTHANLQDILQRVRLLKLQVHDFRIRQRTLAFAQRVVHSAVPTQRRKRHMGDSTSFLNAPDASRVPNTPAFHKQCPSPNFNTSQERQFE